MLWVCVLKYLCLFSVNLFSIFIGFFVWNNYRRFGFWVMFILNDFFLVIINVYVLYRLSFIFRFIMCRIFFGVFFVLFDIIRR